MKELLEWIDNYEERNNFCISVILHQDGSGRVVEFIDEGEVFDFNTSDELKTQLLTRLDT